MPMYSYECVICQDSGVRIVPIAERDNQDCPKCDVPVLRKMDRPGLVYAPTASKTGFK